jgi:predicted HicB family RNase H-like nuclease
MPASKAQQKAVAKYMKTNYDELKIRLPKGRKDAIQAHADAAGQSLNGYVTQAVDERIERDSGTMSE